MQQQQQQLLHLLVNLFAVVIFILQIVHRFLLTVTSACTNSTAYTVSTACTEVSTISAAPARTVQAEDGVNVAGLAARRVKNFLFASQYRQHALLYC